MRKDLVVIGIFAFGLCYADAAKAHPLLDKAIDAYEGADFDAALDAFTEAEGRSDLSAEDLLRLFEWRALVYHAMDDEVRMRADLRRLASIKPTYRLGRIAPPAVSSAFDDVREAIAGGIDIELYAESLPGRLRIVAQVRRDVTNIGRSLEIHSRVEDGDWKTSVGERAVVSHAKGGMVDYYAVLVGPGGAIVTSAGSAKQPRRSEVPRDEEALAAQGPGVPTSAWISWGIAGGALVGAAVAGPLALKRDKSLDSGCGSTPQGCTAAQRKRVTRPAHATDGLLATAGAAAITGMIFFFMNRKRHDKERPKPEEPVQLEVSFVPWGGSTSAGATAALRF